MSYYIVDDYTVLIQFWINSVSSNRFLYVYVNLVLYALMANVVKSIEETEEASLLTTKLKVSREN